MPFLTDSINNTFASFASRTITVFFLFQYNIISKKNIESKANDCMLSLLKSEFLKLINFNHEDQQSDLQR